jgi:hypothetical protein
VIKRITELAVKNTKADTRRPVKLLAIYLASELHLPHLHPWKNVTSEYSSTPAP